jgi:hypothetical protein
MGVSSEIPAIVLTDTGSLKDSSATTKSGLAAKRYKCQLGGVPPVHSMAA